MRSSLVLPMIMAALLASAALAQEHPKEHPEKRSEKGNELTIDELAKGIETYIQKDANLKGGHFVVFDPVDKRPLALTLEKVHRDKLASIGNGVYFACTDMKATDGSMYDLDFFMAEHEDGVLQATDLDPQEGWEAALRVEGRGWHLEESDAVS